MEAENELLRKDAERYRWLRAQHWTKNIAVMYQPRDMLVGYTFPSGDQLDELIDRVMSQPDTD